MAETYIVPEELAKVSKIKYADKQKRLKFRKFSIHTSKIIKINKAKRN